MQDALSALPCVEPSSIKVSVPEKEARFTVKDKNQCTMRDVTKAIKDAGFTVSGVKWKPCAQQPEMKSV